MRWFVILLVAVVLVGRASNAAADDGTETHWYGGPALAVDGTVVLGLAAADKISGGNSAATNALVYGMAGAYLLGVPIVHLVHGNKENAAKSLLLRVGGIAAGVVGVFVVALNSSGCQAEVSEHASCPAVYGFVVPPIAAMLVDDLLVAREPVVKPARPTVSPRVFAQPGLAMVGVGGTF